MVYYTHTTTPVVFGTLFVIYYVAFFVAVIAWFWKYNAYIQKGNYHLKQLIILLLLASIVTSFMGAQLVGKYLYIHSPTDSQFCMTSSCILSSKPLSYYPTLSESLKKYNVPSFGPMWVYFVQDVGSSHSLGLNKKIEFVAVVRPLLLLPVVEVSVYNVSSGEVTGSESFYIIWPQSPGSVLTRKFDFDFTVLVMTGGGGGPGT
ncbi:hypothetical protein [Thermococcus henrietii]|uniref:hypothetical protein n=1 Tax=Thermococcus henrietii TaxID=2016361 RepID=UPI000C07E53E|nr:hypothetical protein [Thermococcus henrietii]